LDLSSGTPKTKTERGVRTIEKTLKIQVWEGQKRVYSRRIGCIRKRKKEDIFD